jgi:hypothetical protein
LDFTIFLKTINNYKSDLFLSVFYYILKIVDTIEDCVLNKTKFKKESIFSDKIIHYVAKSTFFTIKYANTRDISMERKNYIQVKEALNGSSPIKNQDAIKISINYEGGSQGPLRNLNNNINDDMPIPKFNFASMATARKIPLTKAGSNPLNLKILPKMNEFFSKIEVKSFKQNQTDDENEKLENREKFEKLEKVNKNTIDASRDVLKQNMKELTNLNKSIITSLHHKPLINDEEIKSPLKSILEKKNTINTYIKAPKSQSNLISQINSSRETLNNKDEEYFVPKNELGSSSNKKTGGLVNISNSKLLSIFSKPINNIGQNSPMTFSRPGLSPAVSPRAIPTNEYHCSGYLWKFNSTQTELKRFYFVLKRNKLFYFNSEEKKQPKGIINLINCYFQKESRMFLYNSKNYFSFNIFHNINKDAIFSDNREDIDMWFNKLNSLNESLSQESIKNYRIVEFIGQGKFSVVHKAISNTGEEVAIKILRKSKMVKIDFESTRREISILKVCQQENVIKLLSSIENFEYIYIIQELFSNSCDLLEFMKKKRYCIPEMECIIIVRELIKVLEYIHSQGVIHRDLKPENILINPENLTIKVIDFGLARFLAKGEIIKNEPFGTMVYNILNIYLYF